MDSITENLKVVNENIERACKRAGRSRDSIRLVAVTKTKPASDVEAAWKAGQRIFGENYVQELLKKDESLKHLDGLEWHFIGRLQRNKVRHVVGKVGLIQTVDSVKIVKEIEKRAAALGQKMDVLVEVNVGEEDRKAGSSEEEARCILEAIESSRFIRCGGLMALPPFEDDPEDSRKWFIMLRRIREELGGEKALPELSMGMTADYEVAVEEGATIVRVGTAIFGARGG